MRTGYMEAIHPFMKILLTMISAVASLLIVSFLGIILAVLLSDMQMEQLFNSMSDPADLSNIAFLKYLQILQGISLFILPVIIMSLVFFRDGFNQFGFNRIPSVISFLWIAVIIIFGLPVINQLSAWNMSLTLPEWLSAVEEKMKLMEENAALLTDAFLSTRTYAGLAVNLFMIAIIPALGEELFFRGLIQKFLIDWTKKPLTGILLTAFFFSFLHLQFYGFLPRFYLGVLFGLMYYWSGTLWLPVIAHFINNGMAVLLYFFMGKDAVEQNFDSLGTIESNWIYFILSVLLVVFSLMQINKHKMMGKLNT